jgi:cytochrome c
MFARTLAAAALVLGFAAPALAQDAPATGAELFARCAVCHNASPTAKGPVLKGVYGGNIAAVKGFEYSDGLKAAGKGKKWTEANLDAYLAGPKVFAPGSSMLATTSDPAKRKLIIEHLKTLK